MAIGEHGDLLDLIALNRGCRGLHETLVKERRFLGGPRCRVSPDGPHRQGAAGFAATGDERPAWARLAVRPSRTLLTAGEEIETMLAIRSALPGLPCVAALSANHLAALHLPKGLQHLYIASDCDVSGLQAGRCLEMRAAAAGIAVWQIVPVGGDFNDDRRTYGGAALRTQLLPNGVYRYVKW